MSRTITVKGTGKVSVAPDLTVVTLTVRTADPDYAKAVDQESRMLDSLKEALAGAGMKEDDLKTVSFNVGTEYESIRDKNGNYTQKFKGYSCIHGLKLEFDFNSERLADVLSEIAGCLAEPQLNVSFTVKDKNAVCEEVLRSAAVNARQKALLLADASGVKLGELLGVEYGIGEIPMRSPTVYEMTDNCALMAKGCAARMTVNPEDISVTDTVTFVWAID